MYGNPFSKKHVSGRLAICYDAGHCVSHAAMHKDASLGKLDAKINE
jgi:hypothetical protein